MDRRLLLILASWVQVSLGSGTFELQILRFSNPYGELRDGRCCDGTRPRGLARCARECDTMFMVCLARTWVSSRVTRVPPCVLGNGSTGVVGGNDFDLSRLTGDNVGRVSVRFKFAWPKVYVLVVEAWDQDEGTRELIERAKHPSVLLPGPIWRKLSYTGPRVHLSYNVRVICDKNYYGSNCTRLCKPRDDYFGHYECDELGNYVCRKGWTGLHCKKAICHQGCNLQHGSCSYPDTCKCQYGWSGEVCDQCLPHPGCEHGTCVEPWQCLCETNWGGLLCNQDLDYCGRHTPCKNGGTCKNSQPDKYECICLEGFSGPDCEIVDRPCVTNPCQNGASCRELDTGFACRCTTGWAGITCNENIDKCSYNTCAHGGTCLNEFGFVCICPPQWTGKSCQVDVNECDENPCKNSQFCKNMIGDYFCRCLPGWTGKNCDYADPCQGQCLNKGTCKQLEFGYICKCNPGFTGIHCEVSVSACASTPCQHGGKCQSSSSGFQCLCLPGTSGELCELVDDPCQLNPCLHGGTCTSNGIDFSCICVPGFLGKDCGNSLCLQGNCLDVNDCISHPCHNGGTCIDGSNWYRCNCAPGFAGPDCRININECQSSPCPQGATCVDCLNGYHCTCPEGYHGIDCREVGRQPCSYAEQFFEDGSSWDEDCNVCTCRDGIVACTKLWCGWPACVIGGPTSCPDGHQCKETAMQTCLTPPCESTAWCQPVFGDDNVCQGNSTVLGPFNARVPFKWTQMQHLCSELRLASDLRDLSWKLPLIISCDDANESGNIVQVCISTDEAGGTEGAELVVAAASIVRQISCRWDGAFSCAPLQEKLVVLFICCFIIIIIVIVGVGLFCMLRWRGVKQTREKSLQKRWAEHSRKCFQQCCGLLKGTEPQRLR
uniref:Delta-like protein n=1 Tax=Eptatretus burgeri TaxID=7764 RepID=A0A8C4R0G6_EPTBU